jgi:hypothetical protein
LISDSILKLLLIKFYNDEIAGIATNHNPSSIHKMIIKMSDFVSGSLGGYFLFSIISLIVV